MTAEEVISRIAEICAKNNNAEKVYLFGSRAKNTALERSDIDIAVSGCEDIFKLREQIEEIPTLFSVDIVDMDKCSNRLLLEDIMKYGRKIYEKV